MRDGQVFPDPVSDFEVPPEVYVEDRKLEMKCDTTDGG
jgi:hypothetical protein